MKKTRFIFFSIITLQAYAQHFPFMPEAGYNTVRMSGLSDETKTKHGISAGLSVEDRFIRPIVIESGIYYLLQGVNIKYKYRRALITLDFDLDNDSIRVPVFIRETLYGGSQSGYPVNSKPNISGNINFFDSAEWKNNDSDGTGKYQNKVEFSEVSRRSYQFGIRLLIPTNYHFGFNKLLKSEKFEVEYLTLTRVSDTRHKVFQLNSGWKFLYHQPNQY